MPKAFRLAYCEFSSPNLDQELEYYTGVLGATLVETSADGAHYLSLGLDHHNIVLRQGPEAGLLTTGFQLSAGVELDQLQREILEAGWKAEIRADAMPGVTNLLEVTVAGHCFQFFPNMEQPAPGFPSQGIAPIRLGHIAVMTPESETLIQFFEKVLGFYRTDVFEGIATFLTCNYDHHTVNIIGAPITKAHHIAFELRDAGHQYYASDQLAKAGKTIVWGPSRHTAGHNYASYHYDPDRTLVEFYTDMDIYIPDAGYFEPRPWHEQLPQRPRVWPPTQFNAWDTKYEFDMTKA